jgi:PAS domain S-box-containing protein
MKAKLLIVEDEPLVALDLQQEVEQFGHEVVGLAESADEALMAVEERRPDLALMDVRINGRMNGIQTARLLKDAYQVPAIFLTGYSDEITVARVAREMPYGYLTKPFQSSELKATVQVALRKARADAGLRIAHRKITTTVDGMHEALLMVSATGDIEFMNASAERLTGRSREQAGGRHIKEVLDLRDRRRRPFSLLDGRGYGGLIEQFGLSLNLPAGGSELVDLTLTPLADEAGRISGYVVSLRKADERLRSQVIEEEFNQSDHFDLATMPMVQMDGSGYIVRVNQALLIENGVDADSLVGRSLCSLSKDPDPRIARKLMGKLLQTGTAAPSSRPYFLN